jgi:hypothetical protein
LAGILDQGRHAIALAAKALSNASSQWLMGRNARTHVMLKIIVICGIINFL